MLQRFDISNAEIAVSPKTGRHFSNNNILRLKLLKSVFYKKCDPKLIFFNEIFFRKIQTFFDIKN
jgi:hypothetical protein